MCSSDLRIRDRGLAYFRSGAVKILEHSDSYVLAQVEGNLDYSVQLSLTLNSLGAEKAIVFSQFTSFLSIIRKRLDYQGVVYEYLDGKTRNRGVVWKDFRAIQTANCF